MEKKEARGDFARSITGGGLFAIVFILIALAIYMATCAGS